MCGIFAILGSRQDADQIRKRALILSRKQRHRGPDWSGIEVCQYVDNKTGSQLVDVLAHERLSIVDPVQGAQPLVDKDGKVILTVNGEIYNHRSLRKEFNDNCFSTSSDCEPIIELFKKYGTSFIDRLDGVFGFVIAQPGVKYCAARDAIGIFPLYYGHHKDGSMWFASEMKTLIDDCGEVFEFPPGHYWTPESNFQCWYKPSWLGDHIPRNKLDLGVLRESLEAAVVKRLMCDVPFGVLLSGGLDSSLIASIVCRHSEKRVEDDLRTNAWYPRVHTFSVGLKGSPDLKAASQVAHFLGTAHHEFHFTIQEGIDALHDVIYHIESYDVTTVRASTPMFLMSRKIKSFGFKMVLSGEGSDEIFGGYLYFHKAPNSEEFHRETVRKIKLLSRYDCLRANMATSGWGVEARVPFLDKIFLDLVMNIDPQEKMIQDRPEGRLEKWILRKAFDDPENPYLPSTILWRQKEQFSDGVGYGWIDALREYANKQISDTDFAQADQRFPFNTPTTKEAYLYRRIFTLNFPDPLAAKLIPGGPSIACSTAIAVEWDKKWKEQADPSGRAISGIHHGSYPK
ncbi:asparagine synthetase [Brevipalpus obovatus]|uniref:asparagine synthetase n=1 Tax=Brevipalpus obovatus TaxID=246614 RepID=UPI003D9E201E